MAIFISLKYIQKKGTQEVVLEVRVVKTLTNHLREKLHHVLFDNFFTSLELLEDLEPDGLYGYGTACKHRIGFPPMLKTMKLTNRYNAFNEIALIVFNFASNDRTVIFTSNSNGITVESASAIEYNSILFYLIYRGRVSDSTEKQHLSYSLVRKRGRECDVIKHTTICYRYCTSTAI